MHYRKLYWLDNGGVNVPPKVARMNLDGSEPEILVNGQLYNLRSLDVDIQQQVIYWTQAQKVRINP